MANQENIEPYKFRKGSVDREAAARAGKKGQAASVAARQTNRTIQQILTDTLLKSPGNYKQFEQLAKKYGLKDIATVKALFSVICLINSAKKGDLFTLNQLAALLGESPELGNGGENDGLMEALNNSAKAVWNDADTSESDNDNNLNLNSKEKQNND